MTVSRAIRSYYISRSASSTILSVLHFKTKRISFIKIHSNSSSLSDFRACYTCYSVSVSSILSWISLISFRYCKVKYCSTRSSRVGYTCRSSGCSSRCSPYCNSSCSSGSSWISWVSFVSFKLIFAS